MAPLSTGHATELWVRGDASSASLHRKMSPRLRCHTQACPVASPPVHGHPQAVPRAPRPGLWQHAARPKAHSVPAWWPVPRGAPLRLPGLPRFLSWLLPCSAHRSPEPLSSPSCAWPSEHPRPWHDTTFSTWGWARGGCRARAGARWVLGSGGREVGAGLGWARGLAGRLTLQPLSVR